MTTTDVQDHAVTLDGGRWSIWRDAMLRTTGFPVDGLTLLSAAECGRVADDYLVGGARREDFDQAFTQAAQHNSAQIHHLASDPVLREAITWQNRSALVTVDKVLEAGPEPHRSARHRQRERMIARYWQRYCGKADTVGFFGPVCWATIDPGEPAVRACPGAGMLRSRAVYFEYWALAAFAERVAAEHSVRAWLAPALCPQLTVRGRDVIDPVRPPTRLTAAQLAVVSRCDGRKPGWQVAAEAVSDAQAGLRTAQDVYLLLDQMVRRRILTWDFNLPVSLAAEQVLRDRIGRIADDGIRGEAEAKLAALTTRRDRVAAAAGHPGMLADALLRLDGAFTEVSCQEATRRHGEMYAGRTLCVEETTRNLDITFGKTVLDAIGPPLTMLLAVARWLCCALADAYLGELERHYAELTADLGTSDVPLGLLWFVAQDSFYGAAPLPAERVTAELGWRWARMFGLDAVPPSATRLSFSSAALSARLTDLFPAGPHTWSAARLHSPDLQFCARGVESFAGGDFSVVLGEVHAAWAAAGCAAAVAGHPEPTRLRRALRRDLGVQSVHPLLPLDWPRNTPRLAFALEDPGDIQLGFTAAPGADPRRLVAISSIVVRREPDGLTAVAADGRSWPLLEIFGRLLSERAVEAFKTATTGPHTPRITVDRLVVARESWQMTVGECPVTSANGEREEYLAVRRWKAALGLPDYVFVKLGSEVKPIFIDMTSPVYASTLAAALRTARRKQADECSLAVTEMLPTPDQVWVPDTDGRRYVAELRLHVREDREGNAAIEGVP